MTERGVRTSADRKLTYAFLEELPEDDLRHEIIDGVHYVTPSPLIRHQRVARELLLAIALYLRAHPIGEVFTDKVDVLLGLHDIVVPDLVYVSNERARMLTEKNVQGAPDLVIEISSTSTRARDVRLKRALYERAGVQEYWFAEPRDSTIDVYRAANGRFLPAERFAAGGPPLETPLLPGLTIDLVAVFPSA